MRNSLSQFLLTPPGPRFLLLLDSQFCAQSCEHFSCKQLLKCTFILCCFVKNFVLTELVSSWLGEELSGADLIHTPVIITFAYQLITITTIIHHQHPLVPLMVPSRTSFTKKKTTSVPPPPARTGEFTPLFVRKWGRQFVDTLPHCTYYFSFSVTILR